MEIQNNLVKNWNYHLLQIIVLYVKDYFVVNIFIYSLWLLGGKEEEELLQYLQHVLPAIKFPRWLCRLKG